MGKKSKVCSETDLIKGNFAIGPPLQLGGEGGAPSLVLTYLLVEDAGRPIEMGDMFRIARCEVQLFAVPTQGAPPAGTAP
jgi:hypothetical protein